MFKLVIRPATESSPEERMHNRALIERYLPGFMEFFMEARAQLGAKSGGFEFIIPDEDLEFVKANMDKTKTLVEL